MLLNKYLQTYTMLVESINSLEVKGVILGGGRGTRLFPLTADTNKHLLTVGKKPLVLFAIDQLLQAGIRDLVLLIDHRHASQFMQLLQDGSHLGVRSLGYVWQSPEGKGLPSAIANLQPFIQSNRMVIACGDVIIEGGIARAVADFMKQTEGARIAAVHAPDSAGYSLLQTRGEAVLNIEPKDPRRSRAGFIDLGIYMYPPQVFQFIPQLTPSSRGETEIGDLNNIYAQRQLLRFSQVHGWWCDVGTNIETYLTAHKRYADA